jgi:hemoglobin-like flavoprotein
LVVKLTVPVILEQFQRITHLPYSIYFLSPPIISYIFSLSNNTSYIFVASAAANYSMDKVEEKNSLRERCVLAIAKNIFGIGNGILICWITKKIVFFLY